jgi:hypothetical protein
MELSPLANLATSASSVLLSEASIPYLLPSDGNFQDTAGGFPGKPGNKYFIYIRFALLLRRDAWMSWLLLQESESPALSPHPPVFPGVSEI